MHIRPYGGEIAPELVRIPAGHGISVAASLLGAAPDDFREFDLIIMIDVVEHVDQPAGLLSDVAARLRAEGYIYMETQLGTRGVHAGTNTGSSVAELS